MKPTREQIDQARAWFSEEQLEAMAADDFPNTVANIRVLLAATAEPDCREIQAEAKADLAYMQATTGTVAGPSLGSLYLLGYERGARREGAR